MISKSLLPDRDVRRKKKLTVTVCVAAIFEGTGIVGASDRMLTAADVQFEPTFPKIRYFSSSIGGLIAGDANLHAEVFQAAHERVKQRIAESPQSWLPVREVAAIYKEECDRSVGSAAERRILTPFGLTREDFLRRQGEFSVEFVKDIAQELLNYEAPVLEAIIAGLDSTGPHIYTVTNNSIQCRDIVGFASIGVGQGHADSQMMAFNHTPPRHSLADTLLSVFFSKKRAEIAPGVGPATDMFLVTGLGSIDLLGNHVQQELEKRYAEEKRRQSKVASRSRTKIQEFVQALIDKPAATDQTQLPSPQNPDSSSSLEAPEN